MTRLQSVQTAVNRLLLPLDVQIVRSSHQRRLQLEVNAVARQSPSDLRLLRELRSADTLRLLDILPRSTSQIRQDLFVISALAFKTAGYFVEFGAADGVKTSNTFMLERDFGWTGLLLEPARVWQQSLRRHRAARIDTRCVWSESGRRLDFVEREKAGTSGLRGDRDDTSGLDNQSTTYTVETVSLLDALRDHDAPARIDYLSVDTEGSEFEILDAFDFATHRFSVITCEHNFGSQRDDIFKLLKNHGYRRVHESISQFDDWYIDDDIFLLGSQ